MIKTKATQILKTLSRPRNIKYEKHLLLKVESPFLVEKVIHLQYITSSTMTYWVANLCPSALLHGPCQNNVQTETV